MSSAHPDFGHKGWHSDVSSTGKLHADAKSIREVSRAHFPLIFSVSLWLRVYPTVHLSWSKLFIADYEWGPPVNDANAPSVAPAKVIVSSCMYWPENFEYNRFRGTEIT